MNCPVCDSRGVLMDKRVPDLKFTKHRTYLCIKCDHTYKTSEKILFTSLPKDVRERYKEEGKI